MTEDTAPPNTPLTLEYSPEGLEGDPEQVQPLVICEPSFKHDGRIFLGVHPLGRRIGCHLLPEDARRVRDHLSKLLMEPETVDEAADRKVQERVDWNARLRDAAIRAQLEARPPERQGGLLPAVRKALKGRPRLPRPRFRVEFEVGSIQGVVGTTR